MCTALFRTSEEKEKELEIKATSSLRQTQRIIRTSYISDSKLIFFQDLDVPVSNGMVLHIWDLKGQIRACERVVELLRP
jgi:hypothetical protein